MALVGSRRLHWIFAGVNFGWALWALIGGVYFLRARDVLGQDTILMAFDRYLHGYNVVGGSLVGIGVISLLAALVPVLQKPVALMCAAWCLAVAVWLQIAIPGLNQGDIDAWLLLLSAFSCVMRWALLVLEPHVCE